MINKLIDTKTIESVLGQSSAAARDYLAEPIPIGVLEGDETEEAYKLHDELMRRILPVSGEKRKADWEVGWQENLKLLHLGAANALTPRYFGKYPYVRFNGVFAKAQSDTELRFLRAILLNEIEPLIQRFEIERIIEFGCGTGHNLFFLSEFFPNLTFVGTDWSEQSEKIIRHASKMKQIKNVLATQSFDYFNPNIEFRIDENSLVLSVASLEQVGRRFGAFLKFLINKKPRLCLHIEPEEDLLNADDKFDQSSINYMRKRGYLNGFLSELREREIKGEVRILGSKRSNLGSFPMDGYSIIAWTSVSG